MAKETHVRIQRQAGEGGGYWAFISILSLYLEGL